MKIQLSNIVNGKEVLQKLMGEKFPIKTAYKLKKIIRLLEPEYNQFEEHRRSLVVDKYGEKVEEGNWKVKDGLLKDYVSELSDLLSVEVELDIEKIRLPDTLEISTSDLLLLDWIVEFEEENI